MPKFAVGMLSDAAGPEEAKKAGAEFRGRAVRRRRLGNGVLPEVEAVAGGGVDAEGGGSEGRGDHVRCLRDGGEYLVVVVVDERRWCGLVVLSVLDEERWHGLLTEHGEVDCDGYGAAPLSLVAARMESEVERVLWWWHAEVLRVSNVVGLRG